MRPSGVTVIPVPAPAAQRVAGQASPGGDPRALGDPGAPIVVVEYSDFQ
jgi:hypothetical protein